MKKSIRLVSAGILALSLAFGGLPVLTDSGVTFSGLAVEVSAATYDTYNLRVGDIVNAGDTVKATSFYRGTSFDGDWVHGEFSRTVDKKYRVTNSYAGPEPYWYVMLSSDFSPEYNAPTIKSNLEYNGQPKDLIDNGVVTRGGIMEYAVGADETTAPSEEAWSAYTPQGTEVGDYHIWYRITQSGDWDALAPTHLGKASINPATSGKCGDLLYWSYEDGTLTITGTGDMYDYVIDANVGVSVAPWAAWNDSITDVVIESGATSIGKFAFYQCANLKNVTFADTVTTIGESAFNASGLESVTIPANITTVGDWAFTKCNSLTEVTIEGNTTIGSGAFGGSSTQDVRVLRKITMGSETPPTISSWAFGDPLTDLVIYVPEGKASTYYNAESWNFYKDHIAVEYTLVHEAKEPTCSEDGNIAYYQGSNGQYYKLEEGNYVQISEGAWVIPKHHTFNETSPVWSWIATEDGYSVSAKFKCAECGTYDSTTVEATVAVTEESGSKKYTATATFNGIEYTSERSEATTYTITINGVEGTYKYAECVTASAPSMKDGEYFEGWYEGDIKVSSSPVYIVRAIRNMSIEAKYAPTQSQPDVTISMNVSAREVLTNLKQKVIFTFDWELPEGFKLEKAAIVRSYSEDKPYLETENTTVHVYKNKDTRGIYRISLTMGDANKVKPVYVRGYIEYLDKKNERHSVYTDVYTSAPLT